MAFLRQGYDPKHKHSCHRVLLFDRPPQLAEIVLAAGWGGNRNIRNREIRMFEERSPASRLVKNWRRLNDPRQAIPDGTLLARGNGQGMARIICVRIAT